ncbi:hypothetical protein ACQY0O_008267 [Thecaphora frezii]
MPPSLASPPFKSARQSPRFGRSILPESQRPRSRETTRDVKDLDSRHHDMSAEEDELSDDHSPSVPLLKRRADASPRQGPPPSQKGFAGSTHAAKAGVNGAEPSPNPSRSDGKSPFHGKTSSSPTRGPATLRSHQADGPSRGVMQLHITETQTDARSPVGFASDAQDQRCSHSSPRFSFAKPLASAPLLARSTEQRKDVDESLSNSANDHGEDDRRILAGKAKPEQPETVTCNARASMGAYHMPTSASAAGTRGETVPASQTCGGAATSASTPVGVLAPLQPRDDLTPEEVEIFLDLIVKHQPETLSPENMTRSVNALYDDWLAMCATNSIVAKPKKALMEEYDKIYKGRYGPVAASRARHIAEESARTSLGPTRRSTDASTGAAGSESPSASSEQADAILQRRRSHQASDSGSNDGASRAVASPTSTGRFAEHHRESDAEAGRGNEAETRKRKGPEGSAEERSQRRKTESTGGGGEGSGGAAGGIAKVGRNGLAVLPPGLFDILRNHLKDEILSGIVPLIRSDLAEQSRDILLQNQDMMNRLRALEDLTKSQDVWIRRLLERDQAGWTPQMEESSVWDTKKGAHFEGHGPPSMTLGPGDGGYRMQGAERRPTDPSPTRRVASGSAVWPSPASPSAPQLRSSDGPVDDGRFVTQRFHGYDGRLSPTSRSSGPGQLSDRFEGDERTGLRPTYPLASRGDYHLASRDRHRHSLSVDDWRTGSGLGVSGADGSVASGTPSSYGAPKYAYGSPYPGDAHMGGGVAPSLRAPGPALPRGQRLLRDSPPLAHEAGPRRPSQHLGRSEMHRGGAGAGAFEIDPRPMVRPRAGFGAGSPRHR